MKPSSASAWQSARAAEKLRSILGDEKATQVASIANEYWAKGDPRAEGAGNAGAEMLRGPNAVPTDTRVSGAGGFRCTDAVAQGPLNGCAAGEGVRWDSVQLLASTNFKCSPADVAKPAVTGTDRVVLLADFYRAGDGVDESFTAQMIVSETDLAPNIDGDQTLWIQGVGCGDAVANFAR